MYLLEGEGKGDGGSSSMGVMGGGGVMGSEVRRGDEIGGSPLGLCRLMRRERRDEVLPTLCGVPSVFLSRPPTSRRILPLSLP